MYIYVSVCLSLVYTRRNWKQMLLRTPSPSNTAGEVRNLRAVLPLRFLGRPWSAAEEWCGKTTALRHYLAQTVAVHRPHHKRKNICHKKNCRSKWIATKALFELCHLIRSVEVRLKLVPKIQGLVLAHLSQDCQPGQWWFQVEGLQTGAFSASTLYSNTSWMGFYSHGPWPCHFNRGQVPARARNSWCETPLLGISFVNDASGHSTDHETAWGSPWLIVPVRLGSKFHWIFHCKTRLFVGLIGKW